MKRFLNINKFAVTSLLVTCAFVACDDDDNETAYTTQYVVNTANIKKAGNAVDLGLSVKWADMNVGASSEADNGILFSWGDVTGTQIEPNAYSTLLDATAVSDLYKAYKGSEKTYLKRDTTEINYIVKNSADLVNKLLDTKTIVGDTIGMDDEAKAVIDGLKMDAINAFMAEKVDYVKNNYAYEGLLEARLSAKDFDLTCNLDNGELSYRIPKLESLEPALSDPLDYYKKFNDEDAFDVVFYAITTSEIKYFECNDNVNNAYETIKDHYGFDAYQVFKGIDYTTTVYSLAGTQNDAATANWGSGWRIPTNEEIQELLDKCTWEFEGTGYKVTGPNGNSIFLPAAGCRYDKEVIGAGVAGYYASLGTAIGKYHFPSMAEQLSGSEGSVSAQNTKNYLIFQHGQFDVSKGLYSNITTNYAASIRPVAAN